MFLLLSTQFLSRAPTNKIVVAKDNEIVLSQTMILFIWHAPWNTEETGECLLLYTLDVSKGFDRILIKSVDSDTVISTTAAFRETPSIKEIWIELGKGNILTLF